MSRGIAIARAERDATPISLGQPWPESLPGLPIVSWPVSLIRPTPTPLFQTALQNLNSFQWVVFTSQHAVDIFFESWSCHAAPDKNVARQTLEGLHWGVVGPVTAAALRRYLEALNLSPKVLMPDEFNADALACALLAHLVERRDATVNILFPRAADGKTSFCDRIDAQSSMRSSKIRVSTVGVYENVLPSPTVQAWIVNAVQSSAEQSVIGITAASAMNHLAAIISAGSQSAPRLFEDKKLRIVCISPAVADHVSRLGYRVFMVSPQATLTALISTCQDAFKR